MRVSSFIISSGARSQCVCGLRLVLISRNPDLLCGDHKRDIACVRGDPRTHSATQLDYLPWLPSISRKCTQLRQQETWLVSASYRFSFTKSCVISS